VLVTPDNHIVHALTSRYKSIVDLDPSQKQKPEYMSFKGGKEMVVSGNRSYVLSDNAISAYDRTTKEVLWVQKTYYAHRILMADTVLFAGATDTVYALSVTHGRPLWKGHIEGTVYAMAAGDSSLFVSTGEGKIYCFSKNGKNNLRSGRSIPQGWKEIEKTPDDSLIFPSGPYITLVNKHSVSLDFTTAQPEACAVYWYSNNRIEGNLLREKEPKVSHHFEIPVRKDFIYQYRIEAGDKVSTLYEYDNFFNFSKEKVRLPAPWKKNEAVLYKAEEILKVTSIRKGLCLVLGLNDGTLPVALAASGDLDVIVTDPSEQKINRFKKTLVEEGIYGRRISAYAVKEAGTVPVQSDIADLVVCNGMETGIDEVIRLTAPHGKAFYMTGGDKEELAKSYMKQTNASNGLWQVEEEMLPLKEGQGVILIKKAPEGQGVWTAEYGTPDNSAYGGESMWGSTSSDEFEIQWMGRPGPRFQADRNGRKPSPLAINGKLFVQGLERIVAIDAYNGTILWTRVIPGMIRMNVVRDCANWAAGKKYLYTVVRNKLLVLDQNTGLVLKEILLPEDPKGKYDWGYVASYVDNYVDESAGTLVGSAIPKNSDFKSYFGGWGWYDETHGPETDKVMSYYLFAMPEEGGKILWRYGHKPSMIINATITIYDGKVFFVESGSVQLTDKKRGGEGIFRKLSLVALDIHSGELLWRKTIDNKPGVAAYYMAAGNDRLVTVASYKGTYYLYNYDIRDGSLRWENGMRWPSDNHGGHLSRPAIAGNRLMLKPGLFRMDTGERLHYDVPKAGHGCASYALSEQSVFYRGGSVTQFNFDTRKFSKWERLRPDCWISTIPALGMVLSPEGGGGCSCGTWYETSMVMAPKYRTPVMFLFDGDGKFIDTLTVRLVVKKNITGELCYTLDGSEPDKTSSRYERPILLDKDTEIRLAFYTQKDGREVKMSRTRFFHRQRPAPVIEPGNAIRNGTREVMLKKVGHTGEIHYTLDGSQPGRRSPVYKDKIVIDKKTPVRAVTVWNDPDGREYVSEVSSAVVDIPALMPATQKEVIKGIMAAYYEGIWTVVPAFDSLRLLKREVVNDISLIPADKDEHFALLFEGYLRVPEDGIYKFYLTSDDGSLLWLDGKKVVDNDGTHGAREAEGQVPLQAGLHAFRVGFFQTVTGLALNVKWEGPSFGKKILEGEVLWHEE
jgi:outer membrane protein assembly factor BamB